MTSASTNPQKAPRSKVMRFDEELQYLVDTLFTCKANLTIALRWFNIYTIRDLHRELGKDDVRRRVRFKDGDENGGEELFDEQEYEDILNICSYLNWRQNCWGRVEKVKIDIRTDTSREGFCDFISLPPMSRKGSDAEGYVMYDPDLALHYEEINKVGQFAPSASTNAGTPPTSATGSASTAAGKPTLTEDERKLNSFNKKFKPQDSTFPAFKAEQDFVRWKTSFSSKILLLYEENILHPNYVAPSLSNGDSQAAMDLHERQNTHLYTLLSDSVTTLVGSRIVMDHVNDGITVWTKLIAHYGDDVAAEERAAQLFEVFTTGEMDPKCTQLEKFSVGFVRLMKEYNNYCKPSQRLDDQQMLTYYERYIRRVPRLRDLKTQMNTTDRLAKSQNQSPMPVATRLQNYLSNTIILDGDYKKGMLASKRHANFGMIYSGDLDISNILDVDVHAAQSIPDGYVDPGITTFDVNATAFAEDDDPLIDEAIEMMTFAIHAAEGHDDGKMAAGRITPKVWDAMTRTQRKAWMQLGRAMREQLLPTGTVLHPPPPRNVGNVVLPGNGVTGTRGRATNMASTTVDTEEAPPFDPSTTRTAYAADMSDMSIINAMKANTHTGTTPSGGLHSSRRQMQVKDPLDPTRLMSNKNVSQRQLIPIPKNNAANLAMTGNDRRVTMAIASPHHMVENRIVSTAMQTAPVVITNRNVSKVLRSAQFPDIPTSTDDGTSPWSVYMTVMRPRPSVWSLSADDLAFILSLIDGGANVGLANPNYLRLLQYVLPSRKINVTGIGNSRLDELRIGTFAGTAMTTCGTQVILIFHEYGEMNTGEDGGQIVHSKMQLEDGGCRVNDRPLRLTGDQNIVPKTDEGYTIPITYVNGLPHIKTTYPTDAEMDTLPHITMTSDIPWDPRRYDEIHTDGRVYTDLNDVTGYYLDDVVGETGEQIIETVVGETGEQVIETEDDDEEQVIETENDDEDSENELPMLVEQEDESVVPGHVVTRDTAEDYYGDYPAIWYRATKIAKVPRSYQQAMVYDNENENTLWMDAIRKEMKKMEALFGNEFQFYNYTHEVQDSWLRLSGNAEFRTFEPLYLSFSYKRDGAKMVEKARVVSDCIEECEPHALCIRNFWIETLRRRIRSDDIIRVFRAGGPFGRYDPNDCFSHTGLCRCTNGGLLALIELIEEGLVENEMGFAMSPAFQLMQARTTRNQGSVEPRIRELSDRVGRAREQVHTDTVCWECI